MVLDIESEDIVNLVTLAKGAAVEQVNTAIEKCLDNCMDINAKQKKVREISLKIKMVPNEDRSSVGCKIDVDIKLAGPEGTTSVMFLARHKGKVVGVEHNPEQGDMFGDIKNIKGGKK